MNFNCPSHISNSTYTKCISNTIIADTEIFHDPTAMLCLGIALILVLIVVVYSQKEAEK